MLPLVNSQAPEKQTPEGGSTLDVQGRPWLTLQGEGPLAGKPAVFVRLAGCTLKCPQCDTDYTTKRQAWATADLVSEVAAMARWEEPTSVWHRFPSKGRVVVITGGEPFRQDISELVRSLTVDHNLVVQIETNGFDKPLGDIWDRWNPLLKVVVSPKLTVTPDVWRLASAAKYVLRAGRVDAGDGLPTSALGYGRPPDRPPPGWPGLVYVQPEDDQDESVNRRNAEVCVESAMKHGYTVSVQAHKILNLP